MYIHLHRRTSIESDIEPLYQYDRSIRVAGIRLKTLLGSLFVASCVIGVLIAICVTASKIGKDMGKAVTIDFNTSPLVNISCGYVQGLIEDDVFVFKGIPYAVPPVNERRWKPPKSFESVKRCWKGTHHAYNFGQCCYQYNPYNRHEEGSEDCLFINIWTPDLDGMSDVIVYIHGGKLLHGSGSETGELPTTELVKASNMVLVSFNYRLGAFGFLALETLTWRSQSGSSGNYGFMDQIAALKWVKGNIANFGGDPEKVTVAGQGSGATSILALLSTTETRGLFHRAWLMSPSPVYESGILETESDNSPFLNMSGCERGDIHANYDCLHQLSAEDVMRASPLYVPPYWANAQIMDLPTPDEKRGALAIVDEFLIKKEPTAAWPNGIINDVPILIGNMAQEADDRPGPDDLGAWSWQVYDNYIKKKINALRPNSTVAEQVLKAYPHQVDPEHQFTSMVSDIRAICPLDDLINSMSRSFDSPIYRYVITSSPSRPINRHGTIKQYAFRGWELMTFFGTTSNYLDIISNKDKKFSKNLRRVVFQFVRDGKISRWRAWKKYPDVTAVIGSQLEFVPKYHRKECLFWGQQGFLPDYGWMN